MSEEPEQDQEIARPIRFKVIIYYVIGIIALIITLMLLINPPLIYMDPVVVERVNSKGIAKQIGLALFKFENDYGSYPSEETIKDVNEAFPNHGYDLSGTSSDAAFRQLLATRILGDEEMIQKGKYKFAYISHQSTSGDPNRPVLLWPVIPGTKKFDSKNGVIFILKIDQSVSDYKIGKNGEIYDDDGLDILSPNHPMWNGKAPDVRYPE